MSKFVQLIRSDATRELMKDSSSFMLLSLIAIRAKRTSELNINNLEIGQALIGDISSCGLTARQYRTAKSRLAKWGLATFKTTNKGTIATICNNLVFDINEDSSDKPATSQRQTKDKPATTNKNVNNEKNVIIKKNGVSFRPDWFPENEWKDVLVQRKKKKAPFSERSANIFCKEIEKSKKRGYSISQCVDEMLTRNWTAFKDEWMKDKPQGTTTKIGGHEF